MEKVYVNPRLKKQTMEMLEQYKEEHPYTQTPMADAAGDASQLAKADRSRFMRAARALGWNVLITQGRYYENGVRIWNTAGN